MLRTLHNHQLVLHAAYRTDLYLFPVLSGLAMTRTISITR